jgi:uncharacterized protein (TIGR02145 family)
MRYLLTSLFCFLTLSLTAQEDCPNTYDGNADGSVTINDLLDLLGVFGDSDTDSDGIWDSIDDCIDLTACNYANDPTEACNYIDVLGNCGGGCEGDSDNDGICDSEDDCVGVLDECGVCNGPGATEVVIESITILYDSLYAEQIDEWLVFEVGADTVFNYVCDPVFAACGDLVSHDGYDYSTVLIGDQCWFSENCRYLPSVSPSSASSTTSPYYYVYGYEGSTVADAKATENYVTYGVLYNWHAVMTEGICPSGWHIPTDEEFTELTDFLGGSSVAGGKMKEAGYAHWNTPNTGATNSSGFNGLPGGIRNSGGFLDDGNYGFWWYATESSPWYRRLFNYFEYVGGANGHRYFGLSARCVIDYTDECGILNGDNTSCADCCGVPNGDGSTCDGDCGACNANSTCLDECGVPNGDNSTCLDECGVPNGDNSTCADDCGVPNGDNSTCLDDCGVVNGDNSTCFTSCGDQLAHEGYNYSTVQIGDQCWFSENCRYLPIVSDPSIDSTTEPHYSVYGYEGTDVTAAQATTNYATYGVLYNWPAVMTAGICPSGWHIPSDGEFTELSDFLGGANVAGGKMKEAGYDHWFSPNTGATNSSGWTGLPGGFRYYSGGFGDNGGNGYWWSASESGSFSWVRKLGNYNDNVGRYSDVRNYGFSARCVRD